MADSNLSIVINNAVSEWSRVPCPQLSVLLVWLQFLYEVHQHNHWVSRGDSFYGDHLMFQRLYEGVLKEIDVVAEKSVGMGVIENVNLHLRINQLQRLMQGHGMMATIPQRGELARQSLLIEQNFLVVIDILMNQMYENKTLTNGLENMFQEIADDHESNVYLLKQRISNL